MKAGSVLVLAEEVLAAELAYYQPVSREAHAAEWPLLLGQWRLNAPQALSQLEPLRHRRRALARRRHSLRRYMATHLSPAAWEYWRVHGSLLCPAQ